MRIKKGRDSRRRGSRVTREKIVIAEMVSIGFRHVSTSWILFCTTNITPTLNHSPLAKEPKESEDRGRERSVPSGEAPKVASHQVEREAGLSGLRDGGEGRIYTPEHRLDESVNKVGRRLAGRVVRHRYAAKVETTSRADDSKVKTTRRRCQSLRGSPQFR